MNKITHNSGSILNRVKGDLSKLNTYLFNPPNGKREIVVEDESNGWFLTVPVLQTDNRVLETSVFADPGADTAGINFKYALDNYKEFIQEEHKHINVDTPNGIKSVNKFIPFKFPREDGIVWIRKFYLFEDLPVDMLADINLLMHGVMNLVL